MSDWTCYCAQCTGTLEPYPEACEYCWIKSGEMKPCDGCCESLTQKQYLRHYGNFRWPQRKPLIHKGGKP
ncbi:hypothetical protein SEA_MIDNIGHTRAIN_62 [Arthrobacter phage MidnightRain]|nr:hypothetical protein SEA_MIDNIGHTRAIN_62 [Arthrobacter phage MidnightRain]